MGGVGHSASPAKPTRPPTILAPVPGREKIEVVLPVRNRKLLRYFFDHLLRRNAPFMRISLALARAAVAMDLIWWIVPDYFLLSGVRGTVE